MGSWIEQAACRDTDPELFFPIGAAPAPEQLRAARRICGTCPVHGACLRFAVETGQAGGIWAGTTERERRSIREEALHGSRT
ncbi:WhiB family transcriptional regulator [Spongiactinospora sp. TRM90649]|uniref:WhiB family transcriptional regulator n=1 Tax=Spongiactinospora sp. TRM90649 TaxID=3031114 RepID=UPI0023F86ED1|nr:WhiB family transcriptional regulator [Spongiactinospora sp. TRM90649]MDF5755862.1 WhiB family transcriptional regulator [Spongiactinospora sp. TRM90649]